MGIIHYAQFISPSLTTVSTPSQVIAEAAVTMLLQRISGDQSPPIRRLVPGELVVRESSTRVRRVGRNR
jgi:LacI family transcriptional regulator